MSKVRFESISHVLKKERELYLNGQFEDAIKLLPRKESLMNSLLQTIVKRSEIMSVINEIQHNQQIMRSVIEGLKLTNVQSGSSLPNSVYTDSGNRRNV